MNKKLFYLLLGTILCIGFFLRFYKLGQVPDGLYQDETAIGYNAYSILKTGKDEYGTSFPLYFKSFGDYKLPVYIYLTVPSIQVFGMNAFSVRFSSALFGFLTLGAFYVLVNDLSKNKNLALISTFLLAFNPWSLYYNRATFEVSISMFLFVLGSVFLIRCFNNKRCGSFFFGTLCFIISLYSYNLTRLLSPLLYILILSFNAKSLSIKNRHIMITGIISFLLLLPFFFTLIQKGGVNSAGGTLLFSSAAVKAPLLEMRSYLIYLPDYLTKLFFNMWTLILWQYIKNIFTYLSVQFLFISGSSHGNHGIGNVGQFYLIECVFILIGIVNGIKQKMKWSYLFIGWILITVGVASLTRDVPHATRSFFLIVPLEIFSGFGLLTVLYFIQRQKNIFYKYALIFFIFGIFAYNVVYYFTSYYVRFPIFYAKSWREKDKNLALFLKDQEKNYSQIIIDKEAGFIYSSILFYTVYNPIEFQNSVKRDPDDSEGFSAVQSFGKYIYKDVDWTKDYKNDVLIVTTPDKKPKEIDSLKTFLYPIRPIVLSLKQKLYEYPVEDTAYVIVTKK